METIDGKLLNSDDDGILAIIAVLKRLVDRTPGSFELTDELFGRHHTDDKWFKVLKWLEIGIEQGRIEWSLDRRGWKVYRATPKGKK